MLFRSPVRLSGPAPAAGTPVMAGDVEVGVLGSSVGDVALVSVRVDKLEDAYEAGVPVMVGYVVVQQ
mgnify:FL=1